MREPYEWSTVDLDDEEQVRHNEHSLRQRRLTSA